MSTYWYFECHSHNPPLRSDAELSQHTDDDHFKVALELAEMRPLPKDMLERAQFRDHTSEYFGRNTIHFLSQHPLCTVKICSEYGEVRDVSRDDVYQI